MHTGLILLPATGYGLLTLIFCRRAAIGEIAEALVKGHLVLFAFIAVSTEALSACHAISFPSILIAWSLFLSVCLVAAALLVHRRKQSFSLPSLQRPTPLTAIFVGAVAFILATTFAAAILYPPNTWDSMTYHMARVAHWISNHSVAFYPTGIPRQNHQMPLAEFAILHVQILTGCDLYANLVQWVSFIVLICLGLLVAAGLGLSNRQQLLSAVIIAALPMAILQASSTQNDLVASSFVMSFGLFMLRIRKNISMENLIFAATGLGLSLLTKGTAFLYCAAIGTSLAVPLFLDLRFNGARFLRVTAALLLVIIIALFLNAGHLWRNYRLYHQPLSTGERIRNEDMSAGALVSNTVRNAALHLGVPCRLINRYLYRAMEAALGSQLNDPKTTWGTFPFGVYYSLHEDRAGNLVHMLILLLGVVSLPVLWAQRHYRRTIWYAMGLLLGAISYCWILKWQPWASRLHTPLFAMAAPLMAIAIESEVWGGRKHLSSVLLVCMVLYSLPFTWANKSRSLLSLEWNRNPRIQLYFQNNRDLFKEYNSAMGVLGQATTGELGLYLGEDDWEYPFWVFGGQTGKTGGSVSFKHVGVSNLSVTLEKDVSLPLYVIATKTIEGWKDAPKYARIFTSDTVSVFKRSEPADAMQREEKSAALHSR